MGKGRNKGAASQIMMRKAGAFVPQGSRLEGLRDKLQEAPSTNSPEELLKVRRFLVERHELCLVRQARARAHDLILTQSSVVVPCNDRVRHSRARMLFAGWHAVQA
jgi:hypothetical protein